MRSKKENFFSLGSVVLGLRRNHNYILRKINRNVLRESQVLVSRR